MDSKATDRGRTVDLTSYGEDIRAEEDKPLFGEAVVAGRAGALRAAYVMIWLACAESLKRRFRAAAPRDNAAAKIAGDIEKNERDHKSVDKLVLNKAKEYGFLSDSAHTELCHVYDMRCLYGHPYEEAPSLEQVSHAAAATVRHVLSRPITLRHAYAERLLGSMTSDKNYLDDHAPAVKAFASDTVPRLDQKVHGWFLRKFWTALEAVSDDPSMALFTRRGEWFSRSFLAETQTGVTFSSDEWHGLMGQMPKTLARVCSKPSIFGQIGERAQDSLVGVILDEASTRPTVLTRLETLAEERALSRQQEKRFRAHVLSLEATVLRATRLKLTTCFRSIIEAVRSYHWYTQNPALDLVVASGVEQIKQLTEEDQIELGRNILQAAQGEANSAERILRTLSQSSAACPPAVVKGVALECFVNEEGEVRFKDKHLTLVLDAIAGLPNDVQRSVMDEVIAAIEEGTPRDGSDQERFRSVSEFVGAHSAGQRLAQCLEEKSETVPERTEKDLTGLFGLS